MRQQRTRGPRDINLGAAAAPAGRPAPRWIVEGEVTRGLLALLMLLLASGCIERHPTADPSDPDDATASPDSGSAADADVPDVARPEPAAPATADFIVPPAPVREPARHRPVAEACDRVRPPQNASGRSEPGECERDADCGGINGRCSVAGEATSPSCSWDACFTDAECRWVCSCEGANQTDANVCRDANCRVNADCGVDGYCSPSWYGSGRWTPVGWYCHTAQDECIDDVDCDTPEDGPGYCAYRRDVGFWRCGYEYRSP